MNTVNRNYPLPVITTASGVLDDLATIKDAIGVIDTDIAGIAGIANASDFSQVHSQTYDGTPLDYNGFDFPTLGVDHSAGSVFMGVWEGVEFSAATISVYNAGIYLSSGNLNYLYGSTQLGSSTGGIVYSGTGQSFLWPYAPANGMKYVNRLSARLELHATGAYCRWKAAYSAVGLHGSDLKYVHGFGSVGFGHAGLGSNKPTGMYLYANHGSPLIAKCASARLYKLSGMEASQ